MLWNGVLFQLSVLSSVSNLIDFKRLVLHHQPSHFLPQYCHNILTILFTILWKTDNIVNILWQYCQHIVNHMWSQCCEISTIMWQHMVNIYVNRIVKVDNMVDDIVTICWQYCHDTLTILSVFRNMVNNIVNILWQYCGRKCEGWWRSCIKDVKRHPTMCADYFNDGSFLISLGKEENDA